MVTFPMVVVEGVFAGISSMTLICKSLIGPFITPINNILDSTFLLSWIPFPTLNDICNFGAEVRILINGTQMVILI